MQETKNDHSDPKPMEPTLGKKSKSTANAKKILQEDIPDDNQEDKGKRGPDLKWQETKFDEFIY